MAEVVFDGLGAPNVHLTFQLLADMRAGRALPPAALLQNDATLAASALRAIDLSASKRLVAIFHADDPVLLASSRGALNETLAVLADWCFEYKQVFHVAESKTVGMQFARAQLPPGPNSGLFLPLGGNAVAGTGHELLLKHLHKWLGAPWSNTLDMRPFMNERLGAARSAFAQLQGLVTLCAVPLPFAHVLFWSKVEGALLFGRWLWILADDACSSLDRHFQTWARLLIGGMPWRNWGVAVSELGWLLSGSFLAVRDLALRRASLWSLPDDDLYKLAFVRAGSWCDSSWAARGSALLSTLGVPDWPERPGNIVTTQDYKKLVVDVLQRGFAASFRVEVQRHMWDLSYLVFCPEPSSLCAVAKRQFLDWGLLQAVGSLVKLRAGLLVFSARSGRVSSARLQRCIFCQAVVEKPALHVLSFCENWSGSRGRLTALCHESLVPSTLAYAVLSCDVDHPAFKDVLEWAARLEKAEAEFWKQAA